MSRRTSAESARDLHELELGHREAHGQRVWIDLHPDVLKQAARLAVHGAPVDAQAAHARGLDAHEQVLGDVEVREELGVLVHRRDARGPGLHGRAERDRRTIKADGAAIGALEARDDLDERRLAGAVLAEERMDGSGAHAQVGLGQCLDGLEALAQADDPRRSASCAVGSGAG